MKILGNFHLESLAGFPPKQTEKYLKGGKCLCFSRQQIKFHVAKPQLHKARSKNVRFFLRFSRKGKSLPCCGYAVLKINIFSIIFTLLGRFLRFQKENHKYRLKRTRSDVKVRKRCLQLRQFFSFRFDYSFESTSRHFELETRGYCRVRWGDWLLKQNLHCLQKRKNAKRRMNSARLDLKTFFFWRQSNFLFSKSILKLLSSRNSISLEKKLEHFEFSRKHRRRREKTFREVEILKRY